MTFKHFVRLGLFAIATIIGTTSADAGWWHHGGSSGGSSGGSWGGSSGGWGSSGGYTVYRTRHWGSSGGSWGGHRGLFHKHRAYYGSSGYSYGSSGYSTAYYGGSSGGYYGGSSGGYYGGSSGGVYYGGYDYDSYPSTGTLQATPAVPQNPAGPTPPPAPVNPAAPAAAPGTGPTTFNIQGLNSDSVYITVNVPEQAKIFVNDRATKSTGATREYISHGLIAGKQYSYTFRMELNGKSESKTINVTAGERSQLAFGSAPSAEVQQAAVPSNALKTTLILEVPENAKVTLSGTDSAQTGARREFTTDKLAAGEKWENYTIRVEAEVNGEIKTSEKTVTVNAGDTQTISFNDAPVLTAAR
jgi:uncharacterized protein (TIGR03000 family)